MSTMQTIKNQIQKLLYNANSKTGKSHTNLTDGVNELISGYGGGGSAEIPTCTVKFVIGSEAETSGLCFYTTCKDGVISYEASYRAGDPEGTEIICENVVCGTPIYFGWYYFGDSGSIDVEGNAKPLAIGFADNETSLFEAQSEPDTTSVITVSTLDMGDWGGDW